MNFCIVVDNKVDNGMSIRMMLLFSGMDFYPNGYEKKEGTESCDLSCIRTNALSSNTLAGGEDTRNFFA